MDYEQYLYGTTTSEAGQAERGSWIVRDLGGLAAVVGAVALGLALGAWVAGFVVEADQPARGNLQQGGFTPSPFAGR